MSRESRFVVDKSAAGLELTRSLALLIYTSVCSPHSEAESVLPLALVNSCLIAAMVLKCNGTRDENSITYGLRNVSLDLGLRLPEVVAV